MALVTVAELRPYLGIEGSAEDAVLTPILAGVESMFLGQCRRRSMPFQAAEAGRVETRDGTGTVTLFLDYPVGTLTGVTVDGTAVTLSDLRYTAGRRRVVRADGGVFGALGEPNAVVVTYTTLDDLPTDAKMAIMRVAASIYRQRGVEDVSDDREGPYGSTYVKVAADDPVWRMAVQTHARETLG